MQWLILPLVGVTGGLIFYQDLKSRSVTWVLFPVIAMTGIVYSFLYTQSAIAIFKNSFISICFLFSQFVLLHLVFLLMKRKLEILIGSNIGWGDILLLIGCTFFFSPINFFLFYCLSLLFVICLHYFFKRIFSTDHYHKTVPLAGFQAIFLFIYLVANETLDRNLTNDDWILYHLIK